MCRPWRTPRRELARTQCRSRSSEALAPAKTESACVQRHIPRRCTPSDVQGKRYGTVLFHSWACASRNSAMMSLQMVPQRACSVIARSTGCEHCCKCSTSDAIACKSLVSAVNILAAMPGSRLDCCMTYYTSHAIAGNPPQLALTTKSAPGRGLPGQDTLGWAARPAQRRSGLLTR